MSTPILAYHFVGDMLRDGRPVPPDGEWLEHDGPIAICESGLHASRRPWHALAYAPGPILCLVEVDQVFKEQDDKLVARRRRIVRRADLTADLRAFARQCARDVLHLWDAPDVVRRYLETGDESLRDAAMDVAQGGAERPDARDDAREAAQAAVWGVSAWATAWKAAREAAWNAAWADAKAAAWDDAFWDDAAWDDARAAQGERFDALCAARLGRDI